MPNGEQDDIIAFLMRPTAYPARPQRVERMETHGALIFLAGPDVYKIKRAVRFSYMDFSSLEKRRRACQREVEINQRYAPDIYLGLVPVTRQSEGQLALGGNGEPVEWAVHMRRFEQGDLLSAIAEKGPLDPALCQALADSVVAYHSGAAVASGADSGAQMGAIADEVSEALEAHAPPLAGHDVREFQRLARERQKASSGVLARRSAAGAVRRCHGDLHLGNIVLWRGKPVPFDAIEFDEALATVDTLYDLAFLLMDLDHRGQRAAANRVLNRYLWRRQDPFDLEALAALPLFLALRAGVRAMVGAQRAGQAEGGTRDAGYEAAATYLASALSHLAPPPPRLIAIGGLSGTGKSTLAARLAPTIGAAPGAVHVRSDLERKALFHVAETERLGSEAYTPEVSARVYAELLSKSRLALAAGHSVVVDAVYARPAEREAIEDVARKSGVPFAGLWLAASRETMLTRVARRRGDASDADESVVKQQLTYDIGSLTWPTVTSGQSPDDTLATALAVLTRHRTPT